jgi:CubicO group peptidase (beta-lactamase class C family)
VTTPADWLAKLLDTHSRADVPSVSAAALSDDKLATAASADCTTGTLFQAASISKPVAAFAAMVLVDKGKLDLDEDVNARLTTWKLPRTADTPPVTLRHLLCHGGALSVQWFPGYPVGDPLPTLVQILDGKGPANTTAVRASGQPGLAPRYSGGGYTVLQQLLQDITGTSFSKVVAQLVLRPLRMTNAQYHQPETEIVAAAYARGTFVPDGWRVYPELAAAGLWCTPTDLVRFAAGVQDAVAGRGLIRRDLAEQVVAEQLPGWGLGLELAGAAAGRRFGHTGSNEGYSCAMTATVAGGPAIAVMTSSDQGREVINDLVPAIRRELGWPDPTACKPAGLRGDPTPTAAELDGLARLTVGKYEIRPGVVAELQGTALNWTLTIPGQPPLPLEPLTQKLLVSPTLPVEVTVTRDAKSNAVELSIHQPDITVTARRV